MASAGIFYSLMVLSLLAPIVLYIVSYMESVQTQGEQMTVKFEGIELANYADSIALDVPRVLDIASKRAVVAVIDYVDTHGYAVNDSEGELKHLIIFNNYSGTGGNASIMLNSSFANWINATEQIGQAHGFNANITVQNLQINQSDPFTLNFTIELHANITDRTGTMRLFRVYNATTLVPVQGFTDPLYPLNTKGLVERTIKKTNYTINSTQALSAMINFSWYVPNPDAPSFLERLQGCTWPEDNDPVWGHHCTGKYPGMGIESIVYFPEMVSRFRPEDSRFSPTDPRFRTGDNMLKPNSSMVDHVYFNYTSNPFYVPGCNVTGLTEPVYDWLRLDTIPFVASSHNSTFGVGVYGCP